MASEDARYRLTLKGRAVDRDALDDFTSEVLNQFVYGKSEQTAEQLRRAFTWGRNQAEYSGDRFRNAAEAKSTPQYEEEAKKYERYVRDLGEQLLQMVLDGYIERIPIAASAVESKEAEEAPWDWTASWQELLNDSLMTLNSNRVDQLLEGTKEIQTDAFRAKLAKSRAAGDTETVEELERGIADINEGLRHCALQGNLLAVLLAGTKGATDFNGALIAALEKDHAPALRLLLTKKREIA
jgi:hypothetical protein